MIRIAVCDNEKYFRQEIIEIIMRHMNKNEIEYYIESFSSGVDLYENYKNDNFEYGTLDMVFLDIGMDVMNGIETAKKLRELDKDFNLIFITAHFSYAIEGYKVNAKRYILKEKSTLENAIIESINAILEDMGKPKREMKLTYNKETRVINPDDVEFIEARGHRVDSHFIDSKNVYASNMSLEELVEALDIPHIIKIHRAFAINLKEVLMYSKYQVTMNSGRVIPVPRKKYQDVIEKIIESKGVF